MSSSFRCWLITRRCIREIPHAAPATVAKGENDRLRFTFVSEGIEQAIKHAKAAAGGKNVVIVGGAQTVRQALAAGLVDELQIDLVQVLLGGGVRLFEALDSAPIELERTRVVEYSWFTHLAFRVVR